MGEREQCWRNGGASPAPGVKTMRAPTPDPTPSSVCPLLSALFCMEDMNNTVNPATLLEVGATRYCLIQCQQPNYDFEGKYISSLGKMGATRAAFR
jgi:hypothetical protein